MPHLISLHRRRQIASICRCPREKPLRTFNDIPIKKKLTLIAMVPTIMALLLAGLVFVAIDEMNLRQAMIKEISMLSRIIGDNNTAALLFNDPKSAEENLAVLAANQHVVAGSVYTAGGAVFASYNRDNSREKFTPPALRPDGYRFDDTSLTLFNSIKHNGNTVGTVYLHYDLNALKMRRYGYFGMVALVLLTAIAVSLIITTWFSKAISEPLLRLAAMARAISRDKNYAVRAEAHGEDEIGDLVYGFNEMLDQVQERDLQLSRHREELETEVALRTAELRESNSSLQKQILERNAIEEELFRTRQLESLGILAGGIAHDFNNLLTAILGNISLAQAQAPAGEKLCKYLNSVEKAGLRAVDLTQQLLTFSKGGTPIKQVTSIADVICDTARFVFRGSKSKCHFAISDNLWPVEVDPGQISQVIHNLALNADQAMPEGGTVQISAQNVTTDNSRELPIAAGRYVQITVTDTGSGMTAEQTTKIFTPYFTTKQQGSGLGLATSYSIIRKHHGHITVVSEPGAGTTFQVYLPASDKQLPAATIPATEKTTGVGKILVMDDEELIRNVTGEMLSELGYQSDSVEDGAGAIEKYLAARAAGVPYDVVIMDLTIPGGMGGEAAIKQLLQLDPQARAIAASGYTDGPVMSEFEKYGFKGILAKPFRLDHFSSVLQKIMHEHGTTSRT